MVIARQDPGRFAKFAGLRMDADEYLSLQDDGFRYELIDGVVVMSPSPTPEHQDIRGEIEYQLRDFIEEHQSGLVLSEVDLRLSPNLVYRPDLIFLKGRYDEALQLVDFPPDMVLEVLSPSSAAMDQRTKLADYERFGIAEYWIVDPYSASMKFLRLLRGRYIEVQPTGERYVGEAVPGFTLDLTRLRRVFKRYQRG
jgi:Uma2 family endonuclease